MSLATHTIYEHLETKTSYFIMPYMIKTFDVYVKLGRH